MLEVVRVLVHVPDVRHVFLLQVSVNILADTDEAVFVAARDIEELQLLRRLFRIGHQFRRRLCVWRRGETADPSKGVEVSQTKIERLAATHGQTGQRAVLPVCVSAVARLNRRNHVIQQVTFSGGRTPTEELSLFQFVGEAENAGTYAFDVQQTYSDGSIVDWNGAKDSDTPKPTIEVKDSIGGGGSSVVADIALVVAVLALVAAGFALVRRGGGAGGSRGPDGSGGGRALA